MNSKMLSIKELLKTGLLMLPCLFIFCTIPNTAACGQSDSTATPKEDIEQATKQRVNFYELEVAFDDFIEFAQSNEKPFFMDFYASWCTPCKMMDETVYSDPEVVRIVNKKYLAYKVNIEYFAGMDLTEKFGVGAYPTMLFFTPNGELIGREAGVFTPEGFLQILDKYFE